MKPLVSIVMPVYNAERYLSEAIDSILAQTYRNFELVIADDCSTDTSWQIARKYKSKYPRKIRIFRMAKNTNAAGNGSMNAVFSMLKGEFIARMDADDISDPKRIARQVSFMKAHSDAILVGTQGYIINASGEITGEKKFPTDSKSIYKEYFVLHPILHPSVMIRKSLLPSKKRLYENKWGINDDYYTFFKLLQYGKFYNLPEKLLYYRMHGLNSSLQHPKSKFLNSIRIRFQAIRQFGYRPTVSGVLSLIAQVVTISILPESWIVPIYFYLRGIEHPSLLWFYKIQRSVASVKVYFAQTFA